MTMTVVVGRLVNGRDREVGTIQWNGEKFVMDPPSNKTLKAILNDTVADAGGKQVTKKNPERFLSLLHERYRSYALYVTRPLEAEAA